MVDILRIPEGREFARLPFDTTDRPLAPSRRSSISSHAESEASVFSDTSVASTQSSVSVHSTSGWESSTQYDSDEDGFFGSYVDLSDRELVGTNPDSSRRDTALASKFPDPRLTSKLEISYAGASRAIDSARTDSNVLGHSSGGPSVRRDATNPISEVLSGDIPECPFQPVLSQDRPKLIPLHPRRTATEPGWSKPSLVTQDERRLNFVENLVDTATELVAIIWPNSVRPVFPEGQRSGTPVISLRFFIRETLRRSRTSFSTLQVAMYYLALLQSSGNVPRCELVKEQRADSTFGRSLQCGRRMFLASLILASKYLQDRNYFTKAWSRISNLSVTEINRNEMALLCALEYKLHITALDFQKWTDCISKCTSAVQRGLGCPWIEGLKSMNMWSADSTTIASSHPTREQNLNSEGPVNVPKTTQIGNCGANARDLSQHSAMIPAHRLSLLRAGCSVNPTRPASLCARPSVPRHGDLQWPGMICHLKSMAQYKPRVATIPFVRVAKSRLPFALASTNAGSATLPPSPPKTPPLSSRDLEMSDDHSNTEPAVRQGTSSQPMPPPAPREPLLSLNTTPDSDDGASTFGSYLSPATSDFARRTITDDAQSPRHSHSSDARFQADTLKHNEKATTIPSDSPALGSQFSGHSESSFHLPSLKLKPMEFLQRHQNPSLRATDVEYRTSESAVMTTADDKLAIINPSLQAETRRLLGGDVPMPCSGSFSTHVSSCSVVEELKRQTCDVPAEDGPSNMSVSKKCRLQQQVTPCHLRKRGASTSFGGGLPLRMRKAMRV